MADVKPIPEGYPHLVPYLSVDGAARAIEFYKEVFGATERLRLDAPGGKIGHAELELGDSLIMLADESPDFDFHGPKAFGGTPVLIHLYVEDVEGVFERALAAGATQLRELRDEFYGDRTGQFEDPFGHRWSVCTHVEDVDADELARRAEQIMSG